MITRAAPLELPSAGLDLLLDGQPPRALLRDPGSPVVERVGLDPRRVGGCSVGPALLGPPPGERGLPAAVQQRGTQEDGEEERGHRGLSPVVHEATCAPASSGATVVTDEAPCLVAQSLNAAAVCAHRVASPLGQACTARTGAPPSSTGAAHPTLSSRSLLTTMRVRGPIGSAVSAATHPSTLEASRGRRSTARIAAAAVVAASSAAERADRQA
jgi:hypothetical protein